MGEIENYLIAGASIGLLVILIVIALPIVGSFYDFEGLSDSEGTTGSLDIDTDTLEDIQDNTDEAIENITANYDMEALINLVTLIIFGVLILFAIMFVMMKIG